MSDSLFSSVFGAITGNVVAARKTRLVLYRLRKRYAPYINFFQRYITLAKLIMLSLVAVGIWYAAGITITPETLTFMQRDLFFNPLGFIIPVLLATAMFAVPQRIPLETLATMGISVIVTYLLTTMLSSSLGYGSVVLFDTSKYLAPLLSVDKVGHAKDFSTDLTLLYIIAIALTVSILVSYFLKNYHHLQQRVTYISLLAEKLSYVALSGILWLMPIAVFASILSALQTHGIDKLSSLGWFVLYVNIPQFFYLFILVCLIKIGTNVSFSFAFSAIKSLAKIAIPSGSSAATIATNVETARQFPILSKYKSKGFIASLLPFGATVNMDGTALFITIMCKIAADIQGLDIGYLDIIPYVIAYSCAAAAVPSASIVLITAIYSLIGIEASLTLQILGLMVAVDWINDRVRTLINVTGDLLAILLSVNERSPWQLAVRFLYNIRNHPLSKP